MLGTLAAKAAAVMARMRPMSAAGKDVRLAQLAQCDVLRRPFP
jgi:hypothetical protein